MINRACRGHLAGMTNRYLLFIPVAVLGCGGAGMQPDELDELDELESVQADTAAPVITSVMTDDGFRQIRQDGLSHLVVRGNHLDTATSVTVGASLAEIESIAPHEVRASVFAPPGLLGHVDVTVVTAAGTATRPDALRVTPWVMSPTAVGGHGTFQSPMNLCDLEFDPAQPGDTVQLLAGVYECSSFLDLNDGITFEGAGRDKTSAPRRRPPPSGISHFWHRFFPTYSSGTSSLNASPPRSASSSATAGTRGSIVTRSRVREPGSRSRTPAPRSRTPRYAIAEARMGSPLVARRAALTPRSTTWSSRAATVGCS